MVNPVLLWKEFFKKACKQKVSSSLRRAFYKTNFYGSGFARLG